MLFTLVYLIGSEKDWNFFGPLYLIGVATIIIGSLVSIIISAVGLFEFKRIEEVYEKYKENHNLSIEEDLSGAVEAKCVYSIIFAVITLVIKPLLMLM